MPNFNTSFESIDKLDAVFRVVKEGMTEVETHGDESLDKVVLE